MSDIKSPIRRAQRKEVYLKIGITGPSGSGKTYSSLLLAQGLVDDLAKVVVIDTENGSAEMYSDLGGYSVLTMNAPFDPLKYVRAIEMCQKEEFKLIIIDSASHEWDGPGGCLEIQTKLGGKFADWAKVTPMHKEFLTAILQAKCHVICTMRKKQDYAMTEKNGRMTVEKLGLKEIQREGFEYELAVNFDVNMEHYATASKDRTSLFSSAVPFKISKETGKLLKDWNQEKENKTDKAKPRS